MISKIRGRDGKGQDRTGQDRTGQDRTGQDRTGQDRTGQDRTGQDRTGQDRTGQDRTGQDRTGQVPEIKKGNKKQLIFIGTNGIGRKWPHSRARNLIKKPSSGMIINENSTFKETISYLKSGRL